MQILCARRFFYFRDGDSRIIFIRCGYRVVGDETPVEVIGEGHTVLCVPGVIAPCPGHFGPEGGKHIEHAPRNNGIVVHPHKSGNQTNTVPYTCNTKTIPHFKILN